MLEVEIVRVLLDNYNYIIYSLENGNALIIDTTTDTQPLINRIDKLNIKPLYILNTHHHYDHTGGNDKIKKKYGCQIVNNIANQKYIAGIDIIAEDLFVFEGFNIKFINTPGHAFGHIMFYISDFKWLFSGDILFSAGCGRVFEGSVSELFCSMQNIKSLPEDTKVFFGHEYTIKNVDFALQYDSGNRDLLDYKNLLMPNLITAPSTLRLEKKINPFFRCDKIFIRNSLGVNDEFKAFKKLRALRNVF
ncbi:Hydroxyacylglutathione hydrolase [Candidatus Xenohaliotis californiensis]|uniref:Hydroxyacylglutathione hydrolase n=1 Tax=Candidatus Xenohaliotis californiensis TaxID=84677 RepID=A0ABP0EV11_9RICK|nr:Hydroxyacylglutathione hydrolase [Candidatus Xenohaliotis californiensis]